MTDTTQFHASVEKRTDISFSQIATWMSCPHQWFLQYPMGMRPPMRPGSPMNIGDLVHVGIAHYWETGTQVAAHAAIRDRLGDLYVQIPADILSHGVHDGFEEIEANAQRLVDMVIDYATRNKWEPVIVDGIDLLIEKELRHVVFDRERFLYYNVAGHLDAVIYEGTTGRRWVVDYKTRGTFSPTDYEQTNLQNAIYLWLLKNDGIEVDGSLTLEIKNKPPAQPKVNKDGSISRSAVATDWATYKAVVESQGLDPSDYLDMK